MNTKSDVCGVEHVKMLDNPVRKWLHNPRRIFGKWIKPGDVIFDIGCGPGAFTLELAKMAGPSGNVVAIDLQQEMLDIVRKKVEANGLQNRVTYHRCGSDTVGCNKKADFIVTFYMVHETPDPMKFIDEVSGMLKPGGYWYIAEPAFHVSKKEYMEVIERGRENGLTLMEKKSLISSVAVFRK